MPRQSILLLIGLLTLLLTSEALAWGKFGHVTICEIAYREMTPTAREELNRLIQIDGRYTSFNRACLQADSFPRTKPKSHFVNYERSLDAVTVDGCGEADECVISAIKNDVNILADTTAEDAARANALILLGHWVGDIHQPLHVSYKDDRGGNSIRKRGSCSASNLHAVWDNCIVEQRVLPGNRLARMLGWRTFTRAYRAADRLAADITTAQRTAWGDSEPFEWAAESYQITTSPEVDYCHRRSGACWYEPNNKVLDEEEEQRTIQMDAAYLDRFTSTVEERLSQAGVRLGHLLNQALDPS